MTKQEVMELIPQKEEIFLIFSKLTRSAYLECNEETFEDEVFIFDTEEEAKAFAQAKEEQLIPVTAGRVVKKHMFRMFVDLYPIGVNNVNIYIGKELVKIPLKEIVSRPPDDQIDKTKIIENQQLAMSLLYFLQEARKPKGMNMDKIHEMEEEMAANIYKAEFIMPIKKDEVDGKKVIRLMLIPMQDKSQMIPVFSDSVSFQNFVGEETTEGVLVSFKSLSEMELPKEAAAYVLNPAGPSLVMGKDFLQNIKNMFE